MSCRDQLDHSFEMIGLLSLIALAFVVFLLLDGQRVRTDVMLGVCTLCFWAILFSNYILPDPLNSALLVLMIFFLSRERYLLAALMLAPLSVSRESSVLVAICFLAASWKKINRRVIALAVFSLVAGLAIKSMMSAASLGNRHHIPFLAYMILKAPFNFCHNYRCRPVGKHAPPMHAGMDDTIPSRRDAQRRSLRISTGLSAQFLRGMAL